MECRQTYTIELKILKFNGRKCLAGDPQILDLYLFEGEAAYLGYAIVHRHPAIKPLLKQLYGFRNIKQ